MNAVLKLKSACPGNVDVAGALNEHEPLWLRIHPDMSKPALLYNESVDIDQPYIEHYDGKRVQGHSFKLSDNEAERDKFLKFINCDEGQKLLSDAARTRDDEYTDDGFTYKTGKTFTADKNAVSALAFMSDPKRVNDDMLQSRAFGYAYRNDNEAVLGALFDHGASPNNALDASLHSKKRTQRFDDLLGRGVDLSSNAAVNSVVRWASSSFYQVSYEERNDILAKFVANGGDINQRSWDGKTILQLNLSFDLPRDVADTKLLLDHGADPLLRTDFSANGTGNYNCFERVETLRGSPEMKRELTKLFDEAIANRVAKELQASTPKIDIPSPTDALARMRNTPQQEVAPRARRL